ncbi:MAG: substrate-binding domain-containing protein [Actinobacteria bacterium]|nr:substrate-binding domain-containing protein [Actinomycetota bacterium]
MKASRTLAEFCHEAGVRVPDDIAIAGFDDIPEGRYHTPTLTTIAPDLGALTMSVLDLLIRRIEGGAGPAERVEVPWSLQVRESTAGQTLRPA